MMRIVVTSKNKLKVEAVKKAFSLLDDLVEVVGFASESGVGEQPVNEQTLEGAKNRILDVKKRVSNFDRIVSIESGIFREGDQWLDKAVVVIYNPVTDQMHVGYSDAVVFPDKYVELARKRGFDTTTVGQVMEEEGFVANMKDPHLSISGVSRQVYLENAIRDLIKKVELR